MKEVMGWKLCLFLLLVSVSSRCQQRPISEAEVRSLIRASSLVVIGITVGNDGLLVERDKAKEALRGPDLPKPGDFVIGRIVKFRIKEILKGKKLTKQNATIAIFLPGFGEPLHQSSSLTNAGYECLLVLQKVPADDIRFRNVAVYHPKSGSAEINFETFDPQRIFALGEGGKVELTPGSKKLIGQIKREIGQSH